MKSKFNVAVLVGSLRRDSYSKKMAYALAELSPPSLGLRLADLSRLPIYNEDLETVPPPEAFRSFREEIRASDALLFVTPEYNRSVPAVLKNAIDVGSAPDDQNVFGGKPAAIVSLSPGKMGAFGANHHLRQSLVFLNVPALQQPEAYIGGSYELFDPEGRIRAEDTKTYLAGFMAAFENWIRLNK